jgi:hypothetical protein
MSKISVPLPLDQSKIVIFRLRSKKMMVSQQPNLQPMPQRQPTPTTHKWKWRPATLNRLPPDCCRNLPIVLSRATPHLPDELMVGVLRRLLISRNPLKLHMHEIRSRMMNLPNLSLVSKRMRIMALEVYYGSNTFVLNTRLSGLHHPDPAIAAYVQRLEILLDFHNNGVSYKSMLTGSPRNILMGGAGRWNQWNAILRARGEKNGWQRGSINLRSLKIVIRGMGHQSAEYVRSLMALPLRRKIQLRTVELEVVVELEERVAGAIYECVEADDDEEGGCNCAEKLADVITCMVPRWNLREDGSNPTLSYDLSLGRW